MFYPDLTFNRFVRIFSIKTSKHTNANLKKKKCYSKEIFSLSKILLQIEKQKNKKQKNICKLKHSIKFIRRIKLSNIWYFYLKKRNTDDKNKRKTKKKKNSTKECFWAFFKTKILTATCSNFLMAWLFPVPQ